MATPGGIGSGDVDKLTESLQSGFDKVLNATKQIGDAFKTWGSIDKLADVVKEIDDAAYDVVKTFGSGEANVKAIRSSLVESREELVKFGYRQEEINRLYNEVSERTHRNLLLTKDSMDGIAITMKATGLYATELIDGFKDAGYGLGKITSEMQKSVDVARGMGVNVSDVTKNVVANLDKLNLFTFRGGIEGMSRMAAQASMLRVDMGSTLRLADQLFSPEKSIEMAASLQRLGATQSSLLDPLKLMDLAQNDPEELQNQIVEMTKSFAKFNEQSGKFEIAPGGRRQLKEIADSLGMSYTELSKMATGSLDLETKMSKLKFPDFANEDQKKLIANLAEMDTNGEYKIKFFDEKLGKTVEKAIDELGDGDVEMLKKMGDPMAMEEVARQQLSHSERAANFLEEIKNRPQYVAAGGAVGDDLLKMGDKVVEGAANVAKAALPLKESMDFTTKEFGNIVKAGEELTKMLSGQATDLEKLDKVFDDSSVFIQERVKAMGTAFSTSVDEFNKAATNIYKMYGDKGSTQTPTVTPSQKDFIYNRKQNQITPIDENDNLHGFKDMSAFKSGGKSNTLMSKLDLNHNLNLNITGLPSNVDTQQVIKIVKDSFNTLDMQQMVVDAINTSNSNYGLNEV